MKRLITRLVLLFCGFLSLLTLSIVLLLAIAIGSWRPAAGWLTGLVLAGLFIFMGARLVYFLLIVPRSRPGIWRAGSRSHQRYFRALGRAHRRQPVMNLAGLPEDERFLPLLYLQLDKASTRLIRDTAEDIFFHTAISQGGRADTLVTLKAQAGLISRVARLYHPQPGARVLAPLSAYILGQALTAGGKNDVDLGAQIGPAIVGASVVGAIPGANLVSLIIADAVIQGSANALMTLRIGLLSQRYFHRLLEGGPFDRAAERQVAGREALDMLADLVAGASGVLSRTIWEAARNHLRRMPAATYEGLKSIVGRSVKNLVRKKGRPETDEGDLSTEDQEDKG